MNHMKNQIYACDSFPSLDDLLKKLIWCGKLMAKIVTFNSTNVSNCTICILLVSQDYYFLYYQVYEWASKKMITKLEAVDQMYSPIYDQWL